MQITNVYGCTNRNHYRFYLYMSTLRILSGFQTNRIIPYKSVLFLVLLALRTWNYYNYNRILAAFFKLQKTNVYSSITVVKR